MIEYLKSQEEKTKGLIYKPFLTSLPREVPASQTGVTSASPQAFHRTCPALGLSTRVIYNTPRRIAIAYITALKDRVLRN